jgi:RNA polymerase sigma factor (sigma-70 family)
MAELTDHELLIRFARNGDEAAFATLVTRHVNLVWSAARRFTGDDTLAGEVTQAVFIILAQKAGRLSAQTVMTGWLYQTARLTAANALKENRRRQQREHQAYMEATLTPNETNEAWQQLAPVLDEAMHALRAADRDAVLLRFFENKTLADVGAALGVTEDAARVRVNRALDKLRALLAKQGIKFGATAIATAVAENSVQAAPLAIGKTITTIAMTKGAAATASTMAIVKGAVKAMTWAKFKMTMLVGVGVLFATGAAIVILSLPKDPPVNPAVARQILQGAFARISAPLPTQMRFVVELEEVPKPFTEEQSQAEAKRIQDEVRKHESTVPGLRPEDLAKLPPRVQAERERKQAETLDIQTESVRWAHQPRTYREQEWLSDGLWRLDQTEITPKPEKLLKLDRPLAKDIDYERTYIMVAGTNAPDQRSFQIDNRLRSVWYINSGWSQPRCWQAGTLEPVIGFMLTTTLSDLKDFIKLTKARPQAEKYTDSFAGVKLDPAKLETLVTGKSLLWQIKTSEVTEGGRKLTVLKLKARKTSLVSGVGMALFGAEFTFFADAENPANIYRIEVAGSPSLLPLQSIPYISSRDDFDTNGFPHTWIVETPNDPNTTKKTIKFKEIDLSAEFDSQTVFSPEIPKGYQINGRIPR